MKIAVIICKYQGGSVLYSLICCFEIFSKSLEEYTCIESPYLFIARKTLVYVIKVSDLGEIRISLMNLIDSTYIACSPCTLVVLVSRDMSFQEPFGVIIIDKERPKVQIAYQ